MEIILNSNFSALNNDELNIVTAGGWKEAGCAFFGTVGLGLSLPIGVMNPGAGLALAGGSLALLDNVF